MQDKSSNGIFKYLSVWTFVWIGFILLTAILYAFAVAFPRFADVFQVSVAAFLRFVMAKLTMLLPFSLAEYLLLSVPILLVIVVVIIIRKAKRNSQLAIQFSISMLSGIVAFACAFVWMFGIGAHTTPLDQKIGLERKPVSVEELTKTAEILVTEINALTDSVTYNEDGSSSMPYSFSEMNRLLNEAYQPIAEKYPFIQSMKTNLKPVTFSHQMSYTHLTGIYTFYTGEANLNMQFPDFSLTYTAAHELAHQRGISREDEANFVAFLVCMESSDLYLRYCAYLNLYQYVANQLYSADPEAYFEIATTLSPKARGELLAYARFFETYEDSKVAEVTDQLNDAYLKGYGQEQGIRSYGLVVDLAVAYYRDQM